MSIIIRTNNDTLSFATRDTEHDNDIIYEPYPVKAGIAIAANLRLAFGNSPLLALGHRRALVMMDTPVMLVPLEEFDEASAPLLYKEVNTQTSASSIIHKTLPGLNAVAVYAINNDLQTVLNDNFTYDFGTYASGSVSFSIPELAPGKHQLTFRCWDVQNNSTTTTLRFNVVEALNPNILEVGVTENPAKNTTTFILNHDRIGSNLDVVIEVYDVAGRQLWRHAEKGVSDTGQYTQRWDLTTDGGSPLGTGVYLYRVKVSSDGSGFASKVKKLIIIK